MADNNSRGLTIERQSSDFALGDGGRQESVLEPGFVRAPRDMKPPTPVEWGRGDSLMWDQGRGAGAQDIDKSTPLAGYGRDKDLFADAVSAISPNQSAPSAAGGFPSSFGGSSVAAGSSLRPSHEAGTHEQQHKANADAAATFAAVLSGHRRNANGGQASADPVGHGSYSVAEGSHVPTTNNNSNNNSGHFGGGHNQHPRRAVQLPPPQPSDYDPGALTRQRTSEADLAAQFRTQSQVLTDELHQQSKTFPPPPPILAPHEQRRYRAARWYYYATKWDITHEQAPPPRSPLPLMDQETESRGSVSRGECIHYPYRGEYWLQRCEHWFNHVQSHFAYPGYGSRMEVTHVDADVVLQNAFLGDASE